jgi:phosphotransferase system HPr (HPr) family protein
MLRKKIVISDKLGIHMRFATKIVKACSGIESKITIIHGIMEAKGTSIIELVVLEAVCGTEVEIVADGNDESEAMEKIREVFESAVLVHG